jgi:hypothetical protein
VISMPKEKPMDFRRQMVILMETLRLMEIGMVTQRLMVTLMMMD